MVTSYSSSDDRLRFLMSFLVFLFFSVIAVWAVNNGTIYDDEVFSINSVTGRGVFALIRFMNSTDVHPPGAYVINRLLLDLLQNRWMLVKVADGLINAFGLAFFFWMAWPKISSSARGFLFFLLVTAATLVLWGTSVRWYAYYNPIFMVAVAVLLFSDLGRNVRSALLCVFAIVLFHINYVTFCSVPVLLALHLGREWRNFRQQPRDFWLLLGMAVAAAAICVPQLIVFITVHLQTKSPQQGTPLSALTQILLTLGFGHAVFPLALFPLFTGLVLAAAGLYALFRYPLTQEERIALIALAVGIATMMLTGLGARTRNSAYLLPLMWFLTASLVVKLPKWQRSVTILIVGGFQLLGVHNVVAHQRTIKGSYNTDFADVVSTLKGWRHECREGLVVFNHDVVLSDMLQHENIAQSSPYLMDAPAKIRLPARACYVVVKTYHGPYERGAVEAFYRSVEGLGAVIDRRDISPDPDYKAKGLVGHESFYPYYVHLDLHQVERASVLPAWLFPGFSGMSM